MKERIQRLMRKPAIAHAMATQERFQRRLGPQFSAAVTYFSVLSLVPVLMFSLALLGVTLTVLRPDWLEMVSATINQELGDSDISSKISEVIHQALFNWRGLIGVALLTAAYSGTKWVGNLKKAFRVMWMDRFVDASATKSFLREILENLLIFLGMLVSVILAFAVSSAGNSFSTELIHLLGLHEVPGIGWLFHVVSILVVLLSSWVLFAFLFLVLPGETTNPRTWFAGTTIGAILVTILQHAAGLLIGVFSGNVAASVFGPIIVMMLLMNILATIILMSAAWVGTAETWEDWLAMKEAEREDPSLEQDSHHSEIDPDEMPPEAPGSAQPQEPEESRSAKRRRERWAATKSTDELRAENFDPDSLPGQGDAPPVSQKVAARGVRIGMGVGWGVGVATGVGLGAAAAALVARLFKK